MARKGRRERERHAEEREPSPEFWSELGRETLSEHWGRREERREREWFSFGHMADPHWVI